MNLLSRKFPRDLTQYFVLVVLVTDILAGILVINEFKGFLSLSIGTNGITLTVYGK
jgi:hypothetical protein